MADYFSRSKIFLYILLVFILGIFLGPYFGRGGVTPSFIRGEETSPLRIIFLLFGFLVIISFLRAKWSFKKIFSYFLIFLIFCSFGIWRYQYFLPVINEEHIGFYNNTKEQIQIEGLVSSEPETSGYFRKIQVSRLRLYWENELHSVIPSADFGGQARLRSEFRNLNGRILLELPKYTDIRYGDVIQFSARLSEPEEISPSTSLRAGNFSYKNYLARFGVYSIAKNVDDLRILERGRGNIVIASLYAIKNYFSSIVEKIFPEPHSSFMLGLLIGAKRNLPDWLLDIFRITGITHIIAISGYNISILARVAERFLGRLGRRYIFWGVLTLVSLFVILTGAQATIVRAGIMGALLVFAGFVGRRGQLIPALLFAAAVMIFLNPLILRYDTGFQLSFLATLGLIYLSPPLEKIFSRLPLLLREPLSATLSAQILVLPILISTFGILSLISPIANVLILSFVPLAMFLGFLAGAAGIVFLPLGQIVGFFGYIILDIIIRLTSALAKIPYASLQVNFNNWWVWGIYYLAIFMLLFIFRRSLYPTKKNI